MTRSLLRLVRLLTIVVMLVGSGSRSGQAQEATPGLVDDAAAEWRMPGANAARTGAITASGLATMPTEQWRIPIDLSQQPAPLGPLMTGDTAYLWSYGDQRLHAFDSATGTERWQADVGMASGIGADLNAAIGEGALYIVGTAGELISSDAGSPLALFAFDVVTGQERWRVSFTEEGFVSALAVVGTRLLFSREGPSGNAVYALDMASGQDAWRAPLPASVLASVDGGVTATTDTVYLPTMQLETGAGALLAFDLTTGAERWRAPTAGSPRYGAVMADDTIILTSFTEDMRGITVEALDAATGTAKWQFAADEGTDATTLDIRRIVAAHGLVYVDVNVQTQSSAGYTWTNAIIALDVVTGGERWRAAGLDTPVVAGAVLYAGTFEISPDPTVEHALVALDALTGEELWRLPGRVRVLTAGANLVVVESHEAVIAYGP